MSADSAVFRRVSSVCALWLALGCGASPSRTETVHRDSPPPTDPAPASDAGIADEPADEPEPPPLSDDPEVRALTSAFVARLTVWTRADGRRVLTRRCREGPVDCRARLAAFAELIVRTARRHELDPYLLAALAMRESGLNPAALGVNREAGIIQLHPRGAGRDVRYVQDDAYRERCQSEIDACQGPVLERGAQYLADAIRDCGGLVPGLGKYSSGHCTSRGVHAQRVIDEQRELREAAESGAQ